MESSLGRVPRLAPGVEIGPEHAAAATVTVAAPPERWFEISPATARLLRAIDGRRTIEDLARIASQEGPALSAVELDGLIEATLVPRGLVYFDAPPASAVPPRSRLWLRFEIFPAALVNPLVAPLSALFRKPVAFALIAIGLAAQVGFYATRPSLGAPIRLAELSSWMIPVSLFVLATLLHEFGHAAALRSRGEKAGAIGLGLYWIWPVLFSDVSRAWRLERRGRAIVDSGGMLVQLIAAAAMIAWWSWRPGPALARGIALVDLGLIANLNPFLRWDGYWLLADLAGVSDLRRRSFEYAMSRLRGRRDEAPRFVRLYAAFSLFYVLALALWLMMALRPWILRAIGAA